MRAGFLCRIRLRDLDDQRRVEQPVLDDAFRRIAARVGNHPRVADPIVEAVVGVSMQPELRLPPQDLRLEVADETGVERRAGEAAMDALA